MLNPSEVVKKTGLSRVTLWRLEKIGQFPARVNLTEARVGWPENEIDEWIESRPRGICNREIRKETADVRG
ncbi:MAG: AlpA family phage regulatory protein [Nitrospina sp.]|nr:AlpA family phage regulatory protein [Nitrospina sp.]